MLSNQHTSKSSKSAFRITFWEQCITYTGCFFFNSSAQISVLKRKTLLNQQGSLVHREFDGTESLIGGPSFFILVLKIGRNSSKKHPVHRITNYKYIHITQRSSRVLLKSREQEGRAINYAEQVQNNLM